MLGPQDAAKSQAQRVRRTTDGLRALDQIELDGRVLDILVDFGDGKPADRPTIIGLVDRASFRTLAHVIVRSENAEDTADLIARCCDEHGIPDVLLTDNGAAFKSDRIAGEFGVAKILVIELRFCTPHTPWAKLPESKFSAIRYIDNLADFAGAHTGSRSDRKPSGEPTPVSIELVRAVFAREIALDNAELGRRSEQARGGSYDQAFERLNEGRIPRIVAPDQRRRLAMKYYRRTVQSNGTIRFLKGVFGSGETQERMLRHEGERVLIGVDPRNYNAPAMVFELDKAGRARTIVHSLPAIEAVPFHDEEGRRRARREKLRTKSLVASHALPGQPAFVDQLRAEALGLEAPAPAPLDASVVGMPAKGPFHPDRSAEEAAEAAAEEQQKNEFGARMLAPRKGERPAAATTGLSEPIKRSAST